MLFYLLANWGQLPVNTIPPAPSSLPVQVEGSDLCVVPLKVREVVEVEVGLLVSLLPVGRATHLKTSARRRFISS